MEKKTRLYLVRHGETTVSAEYRYIGHRDVDINENGVHQMYTLMERFKDKYINGFYCSDLIRSKKGAEIIASCHNLIPIVCKEFREIHLGIWEGLTREEIIERYPEQYTQRLNNLADARTPGGESFRELQTRVTAKLTALLAEHKGETIILVAHGGVNRVIIFDILKLDLQLLTRIDQRYGCVNIIDYYEDGPVITLVNG